MRCDKYKDTLKNIDNSTRLCYSLNTFLLASTPMINLDSRYQDYLTSNKRLRIDGVEEKVTGYGYLDDGKDIIGYYLTTDNYKLRYNNDGVFLGMEAVRGLKEKAPD